MTRGSSQTFRRPRHWQRLAALLCVASGFAFSGCRFEVSSSGPASPVQPTALSTNAIDGGDKEDRVDDPKKVEPNSIVAEPAVNEPLANEKPATDPPAETKRPRPEETVAITFDDLNLQMQADMAYREWMLTDRAKELDGRRIRIAGAMLAGAQPKGVKQFVLLRNKECKFGQGGQADHLISVTMKDGLEVTHSENSVQIEGVLKIRPFNGPDGNTWSLYDLVSDSFKVLRK